MAYFLSPTATDIKAWGAVSEANGTLGPTSRNALSLKATHIFTIIVARFQRAGIVPDQTQGSAEAAPPWAIIFVAVGDKKIGFDQKYDCLNY